MTRPSRPVMGVSVKMDVGGTCAKRSDTGAPFSSSFRDRLPIRGRGREAACAQVDDHHRHDLAAYEMAVERARYEADRALRQLDNVEPKNRLIARTS